MKQIPLSQGKFALVDDADFDWLNQWKWCLNSKGYAVRSLYLGMIEGKKKEETILMHKLIRDPPHGMKTDHDDLNKLNNQRYNLRLATDSQNNMNTIPRGGASKFKGVVWYKHLKKWGASIQIDGKKTHLGIFDPDKEIEAAKAYNAAAIELHGEFARLNIIS